MSYFGNYSFYDPWAAHRHAMAMLEYWSEKKKVETPWWRGFFPRVLIQIKRAFIIRSGCRPMRQKSSGKKYGGIKRAIRQLA